MKIEHPPAPEGHHGEIVARVPREDLRALFHVLTGKPDSLTKIFPRPAVVTPQDIQDLHARVYEKLEHHSVPACTVSVSVVHEKNLVADFAWSEFVAHRWTGAEVTKSISVKWDFMVQLPTYKVPQRHTLTLRMSSEPRPLDMLQMVLSPDSDVAEAEFAPMFCRVDFINALLSQELINIVVSWQESLQRPPVISGFWRALRRRNAGIHQSIHQLFRVLGAIISIGALAYLLPKPLGIPATLGHIATLVVWLFAGLMVVDLCENVGHHVAAGAAKALENYGKYVVLRMTKGDANKQSELDAVNRKSVRSFLWRFSGAVLVNVVAGIISAWLIASR
jgi:hypothetical protein